MNRVHSVLWFGLVCVAVTPGVAFAHALLLSYQIDGDELRAIVRYDRSDDHGGAVTVTLTNAVTKETVAEKPLDSDGICRFPKPPKGKYILTASDKQGHFKEVNFAVTDANETYEDKGSSNVMVIIGIAIIGTLTAGAWWWQSGKGKVQS